MTPPPLFATWLGYLTAILSLGALSTAIAALVSHKDSLEPLAARLTLATAAGISVTTIAGLSIHINSFTSDAVYTQLFLAATLFTAAVALADWRSRDADVLWNAETRILYLGGHVGCLGLAIATIWMG